ncbi:MAG: glycoside hydrolase family 5 protein [Bacilli bacterium]|nr:glycoside hydrolase family 5 protein [Bacilli bacterium]
MKKYLKLFLLLLIFVSVIGCTSNKDDTPKKKETKPKQEEKVVEKNNYPSYNGFLKVDGTKLVNEKGEEFILKGVSSHGIQWFGNLYTKDNLKLLKEDWNTNVFRIAMYTKEGGYIDDSSVKEKVISLIDNLIDLDMYVIVDWHILSDNNPTMYTNESKEFFNEISSKYKDKPNVIYEICNEPNGGTTFDDITTYANEVIPVIRNNSPKSLIIVGTPTWSQDVDKVNKLGFDNILYSLHFYSGTHTEYLRDKVRTALSNNIPIIVSEFGVSDASGNGGVFLDETDKWISFLKENKISIISWSLANKNESSAILKESTSIVNDDNLTEAGKYLKEVFKNY